MPSLTGRFPPKEPQGIPKRGAWKSIGPGFRHGPASGLRWAGQAGPGGGFRARGPLSSTKPAPERRPSSQHRGIR